MTPETTTTQANVLVICLCAEWCGVCREYRSRFTQVQAQFPQAQFLWIDVEDDAELLDPLEVEDFPTLLLAVGDSPRFFGVVAPHPGTLERLVRTQTQDTGTSALAPVPQSVAELVARIRRAKLAD